VKFANSMGSAETNSVFEVFYLGAFYMEFEIFNAFISERTQIQKEM